jgi:hypothetical protein
MHETHRDDALAPAERLMGYFDRIAESAAETEWRRGRMVPDLSGEIADDAPRARPCAVLAQQSGAFENVVRLARPDDEAGGSISSPSCWPPGTARCSG